MNFTPSGLQCDLEYPHPRSDPLLPANRSSLDTMHPDAGPLSPQAVRSVVPEKLKELPELQPLVVKFD